MQSCGLDSISLLDQRQHSNQPTSIQWCCSVVHWPSPRKASLRSRRDAVLQCTSPPQSDKPEGTLWDKNSCEYVPVVMIIEYTCRALLHHNNIIQHCWEQNDVMTAIFKNRAALVYYTSIPSQQSIYQYSIPTVGNLHIISFASLSQLYYCVLLWKLIF